MRKTRRTSRKASASEYPGLSVSEDAFRLPQGGLTGQALIDAMQASPYPEVDIEPERFVMPVRDVVL